MSKKNIYVTKPPLEELVPYLQQIWNNKILVNGKLFHQQLEKALCEYLGVEHISLFTDGTIAPVTALQTLRNTDAEGSDLHALFMGVLQQAGKKIAGDVGDKLAQKMSGQVVTLIGNVFEGPENAISNRLQSNSEKA